MRRRPNEEIVEAFALHYLAFESDPRSAQLVRLMLFSAAQITYWRQIERMRNRDAINWVNARIEALIEEQRAMWKAAA